MKFGSEKRDNDLQLPRVVVVIMKSEKIIVEKYGILRWKEFIFAVE